MGKEAGAVRFLIECDVFCNGIMKEKICFQGGAWKKCTI